MIDVQAVDFVRLHHPEADADREATQREQEAEALKARFRSVRYGNRMTETRTEFGNELDAFEAALKEVVQ